MSVLADARLIECQDDRTTAFIVPNAHQEKLNGVGNLDVNRISSAVPNWEQTSLIPSDLPPKRDWGPKGVN